MHEMYILTQAEYVKAGRDLPRNTELDESRTATDTKDWDAFPKPINIVCWMYHWSTMENLVSCITFKHTCDHNSWSLCVFVPSVFRCIRATRGLLYDKTTSSNVITSQTLKV